MSFMKADNAGQPERWAPVLRGFSADLGIWLWLVFCLSGLRILLICQLVPPPSLTEALHALLTGVRFDSVIATATILPSVLIGLTSCVGLGPCDASAIRRLTTSFVILVSAPFYAVNFRFFCEFSNQLDQRVLAIFADPDGSIFSTIWEKHHPVWTMTLAGFVAYVAIRGCARAARLDVLGAGAALNSVPLRSVFIAGVIATVVWGLRGMSLETSPVRVRNSFRTANNSLNRTIPSPIAALLHSLEDRATQRSPVTRDEYNRALECLAKTSGIPDPGEDVQPVLSRFASGSREAPQHVFLVILEGQHGFPLLDKYEYMGLFPALARLAKSGAHFPKFIPSGLQTDETIGAVVGGLLTPGISLTGEEGSMKPFPTALAPHFSRMGYRTRFFYGGYLGWARLDLFLAGQKFDEIEGAGTIRDAEGNAWGVWDEYLFRHVLSRVDPDRPSLNVILTTTNHSPYDLPASRRPAVPTLPDFASTWNSATLEVLQHEQYVDRELGSFVSEAERRFPGALFVITGDHAAHAAQFVFPQGSDFENLTVPLIFYGPRLPETLRGTRRTPASHLDIAPTLYELCARAGYTYLSFGRPLDGRHSPPHALGHGCVITENSVTDSTRGLPIAILEETPDAQERVRPSAALDHYAAVTTLSRSLLFGWRTDD